MRTLKRTSVPVLVFALLSTFSTTTVAQSPAQNTFDRMKTLAGEGQGSVTTTPAEISQNMQGSTLHITLRTTSSGNAILHEMNSPGMKDDPITMLYLDNDRLLLTHYCDAGNRPRMVAHASPDGRTIEFTFLDLAGPNEHGHMDHAIFTFIDANHHTEDWTYMLPGDKPMLA